jgi:hypothetical protein
VIAPFRAAPAGAWTNRSLQTNHQAVSGVPSRFESCFKYTSTLSSAAPSFRPAWQFSRERQILGDASLLADNAEKTA